MSSSAGAQNTTTRAATDELDRFSDSVQTLIRRVAPSVVQIVVTRPFDGQSRNGNTAGTGADRRQTIGSGVIIASDGFIVTNAHVVADAQRIRVKILATGEQSYGDVLMHANASPVDATLIGMFKEADLALLKIGATGLPALQFAEYRDLRQGQLVFAFGSPDGLTNSVSMGVVSSIARQPDVDSPFIYIQTDAPINPGNSGGPLVNSRGELVGLDTFILTQSGGSEGIGFAIPSVLVQFVSMQLRKYGHFHRTVIGVGVQTVTPVLRAALKLPRDSGVIVSDVVPGSPAQSAGVQINDILLSIDGTQVENLPGFMMGSLAHDSARDVRLQLLRGTEKVLLNVHAQEDTDYSDRLRSIIYAHKTEIPKLGIAAIAVGKATEGVLRNLRSQCGVVVVAQSAIPTPTLTGLQVGDVIYTLNGTLVGTVADLQEEIGKMKQNDAVALLVEREGKLLYLTFEIS
jgi:serine protease Do